jgi:tRNA dimethylallyltransferase
MPKPLISKKPLIYAVVGPTASGKSEYAVTLAKKHNGEILSVDSRQIYTGMDIGSGKVKGKLKAGVYIYKGIPHYGIDITSPKRQYSAARFQVYAHRVIADILKRNKTPILCGGTAHWIDAVVFNQQFPDVKPNKKLRTTLEKKTTAQLYTQLKKLDPKRAESIEQHNPRRLIRALEIVLTTKQPVPELIQESPYTVKWIGIKIGGKQLVENIQKRLAVRLKQGMLDEIKKLRRSGLSWKRLESFGLEYKYCALLLQKKVSHKEMVILLSKAIEHYAKRQMTWWKRNKDITWIKVKK